MSQGYEALRAGAALLNLSARARVLVRGRDRARLLHNVTSNEIKKLTPGTGCYAFFLTPQGRIQGDVNVFCFADYFLLDAEPELRDKLPQLVLKYKVADQVEVQDANESMTAIGIEGPKAAEVLAAAGAPLPAETHGHLKWGASTVARVSITGQPGYRIFSPAGEVPPIAGAEPATEEDVRLVRIESGLPRYGEDIRESSLPQETQQMHAVSFTKGCYLGQEIVERIRARGRVNRTLERIDLATGEVPAPGTKLMWEGREAEVTSAVYSPAQGKVIALAYVRAGSSHPQAG